MKTVVCGASRPIKWKPLAAAIMWWEDTPVSHAYFYIERQTGVHLLYQAIGSGTEFMGYKEFCAINKPVYEKRIEITDENFQGLLDFLIPRLKKKYSVRHLIGLFLKRVVYYFFNKKIPNYFADKDASEICVEALCSMLQSQKIYALAENPEDVGMFECLQMLKEMPGKEILV